ncbi:MAG: DUF63 family protein [Halobacteriaceae archaeon]
MALLPAGSRLPPWPHALVLLAGAVAVAGALRRRRPAVDDRTVLALAPWMVLGAVLYVARQLGLVPDPVAPFAGSPTVYGTVAVLAGATWVLAGAGTVGEGASTGPRRPALATLASVGALGAVFVAALAVGRGVRRETLTLTWPLAAVAIAALLTALGWWLLGRLDPETTETAGGAGALALFGHALDGVSTAVGYDVLGFGERSPLSRAIIEFASTLPTADLLGAGWLFVAVKVALSLVAVWLLVGYVREAPPEGYALLGFVAAVGLGPGAHNVLLFAVVQPQPATATLGALVAPATALLWSAVPVAGIWAPSVAPGSLLDR